VRFAFFVSFVSGLRLDATIRRNLLRKTRLSGVTYSSSAVEAFENEYDDEYDGRRSKE